MQARDLMNKASLGPKALRVIYQAFDEAWAEIVIDYSADQAESARTRLASTLLQVASDDSDDAKVLKKMALQMMTSSLP
jgi:hypothetical protein